MKLTLLPPPANGELSDRIFKKCFFCDKDAVVSPVAQRLARDGNFYCTSCLRRGFHTKSRRHFFVTSFRNILGHFHSTTGTRMALPTIDAFVKAHAQAGLANPVFDYDPDTLLWFIDFSRVGTSKKKIPLGDVSRTVVDILASFNLLETIPGMNQPVLYAKYDDAIVDFYNRRHRAPGHRVFIPTLQGCVPGLGKEDTRIFVLREMSKK